MEILKNVSVWRGYVVMLTSVQVMFMVGLVFCP
jgi:hypothetical protein